MEIRRKDYAFLVAFVSATFLSIVFMTVILPNIVFQPQPSQFVVDLNEKQLRGRDIYKREGCVYCHSQFVRPQDRNGGPVSLAGDFEFYPETVERAKQMDIQLPHLLGTLRTGPDLTNIGGLMSDAWHKAHHRNPRAFNPGSVMPSFDYLSEEEMDDLVAYIQTLGVKKNELSRKYQAEYAGNFNEAYELADGQAQEESYAYLIEPDVPYEFKVFYQKKYRNVNPVKYANRYIAGARGIYNTKCATCHGVHGDGNGPRNLALTEKPANFQSNDPNMGYDQWSDIKWYWKIAEGAGPGAVMPRWNGILEPDQIWYLVQYCKYLAADRVMPDAPRWMPLMPEGYLPPTYHFEGDDLIVRMPSRPAGTSATEPAYIPDVQVQTGRPVTPPPVEEAPETVAASPEERSPDTSPAGGEPVTEEGETPLEQEVPAGGG